jgi:hypothetical protein
MINPGRLMTRALAAVFCATLLVACGGGSGGGQPVAPEPPANRSPVASASAAQSVSTGTAVSLDASASSDPDGDSLSYAWNLAGPAGSTATLATLTTGRPSFTPDLPGTYVATFTVADGRSASASATVSITFTAPYVASAISLGGQTEPLSGTVKLSLTGTVTGAVGAGSPHSKD